MKILGIETSCDETAISLIEVDPAGTSVRILGNTIHSQVPDHVPYGGVFPMLAKREHEKNLPLVLDRTMDEAGAKSEDVDLIAITIGPGLEPALWTGIVFAKELAQKWNKKIVPAHHMEGHILAALISQTADARAYKLLESEIAYPALSLLISGGHTQIVLIDSMGSYKIAGETRDDAIGECFDKVARTLGLEYPGGPKISKLAAQARAENIQSPEPLPRPMMTSNDLDFSFSGLKTAVLYLVQKLVAENGGKPLDEKTIKGIARETEDAVTDVVLAKVRKAIEIYGIQSIIVGGGVIANKNIRTRLEELANECSTKLFIPQVDHSTDNGLMIALAGYFNRGKAVDASAELKAKGTLPLGPKS
ncbi:MAG TPA: tRNA (adenosine(37)-N6)-threonylcarbamoyltransferase complex transferase subunit TsaD [Candidatus Paceibacterota bacterium]